MLDVVLLLLCAYMLAYMCVYACMYLFVYIYIYIYVCVCVGMYIYIYIYMSIYMSVCVAIFIRVWKLGCVLGVWCFLAPSTFLMALRLPHVLKLCLLVNKGMLVVKTFPTKNHN